MSGDNEAFASRCTVRIEADLGKWLETLTSGRPSSAFTEDVADTSSVLRQAAASLSAPLRVVSLTWPEVPPLANELGLLVSALAEAVKDFFPVLYGRSQERAPAKWSQSFIESEAHAITRQLSDVQGTACRRSSRRRSALETPSLGSCRTPSKFGSSALAIEPERLLVVIAVLATPAAREQLKSLAQGAEWLASNTASRVALILPRELAARHELDHVTYGACVLGDDAENAPVPGEAERRRGPGRAQEDHQGRARVPASARGRSSGPCRSSRCPRSRADPPNAVKPNRSSSG